MNASLVLLGLDQGGDHLQCRRAPFFPLAALACARAQLRVAGGGQSNRFAAGALGRGGEVTHKLEAAPDSEWQEC